MLPPAGFAFPVVPRYAEIDQQSVVFNAHYLIWFDEAFTAFLDHLDVSYPGIITDGYDVQVVHAELDFAAPVRWRDDVRVAVACERMGTTSFTIAFTVVRRGAGEDDVVAVTGRNVYVVLSTASWTKQPVPDQLRAALAS